jgi:hypothetical protein
MKKQVTVAKTFCDLCGSEDCWERCRGCGKDVCLHCYSDSTPKDQRKAVRYAGQLYFSSSGDAVYCIPCDIRLSETKESPLHEALVALRAMRDEQETWSSEFEKRREIAEQKVSELR